MASWDLLDDKVEADLHKSRLLNVEEKPFKRITKRIGLVSNLVGATAKPSSTSQNGDHASPKSSIELLKEDLMLDFAAFDSNISRLQFLHDSNARERERYQADQQRILAEGQAVRASNVQLREQLEEARATLAQRKKFDELAEKITSNRLLRPRDDQIANLAKLEEECKELERESETYSETWKERREQFNRIMDEGMQLRRQIRDEKEEVDRREGMNEGADDDDGAERGGQTPRIEQNDSATPRPEGDSQLKPDAEGGTPRPSTSNGGRTPARDTPIPDSLQPTTGSVSRSGSRPGSRNGTPAPAADDDGKAEEGEDVEMDNTEQSETPRVNVEPPENGGESMEVDN